MLGVLDEGLHIAQAQRPGGDYGAADHCDGHVVEVPDDQHDWHHDFGEELRAQRGSKELLILGGESLTHRVRGENLVKNPPHFECCYCHQPVATPV